MIAAHLDEGSAPSVREIAVRAKLPRGKRDVMLCVALLRRLEADGLLHVEWADAKPATRPPARNRYEVTLGTERGRVSEFVRLHPDDREAIARRIAELLRDATPPAASSAQLLTASEVADRFGVSRDWVYEHKATLGAIPMTAGLRPRLRFDPVRVAAALAPPAESARVEAAASQPRRRRRVVVPAAAELLPIRGRRA